jgi:hypothetical protein
MNDQPAGFRHATASAGAMVDSERKLQRRDWILMPVLSLLTIGFLVASSELIARRMFPQSKASIYDCALDGSASMRGRPNAVCRGGDNLDTPIVEYRLNRCGHRAGMECGPKAAGTFRIVLVGSSLALGACVPAENAIATLLPREISQQTERKVELYNESMFSEWPHAIAQNFGEVTAAKPDAILWLLTPHDIMADSDATPARSSLNAAGIGDSATVERAGFLLRTWRHVKQSFATRPIPEAVGQLWQHGLDEYGSPPSVTLLRHFLYESQMQYVKSFLKQEDSENGFLRTEPTPKWQSSLRAFDANAAKVQAQAKAAGVPLVVLLVPNRAQAAMISVGEWPVGYNPYKLDDELRSIVISHDGTYIDILPSFRNIPNPEQYYYPVDGHPNADGHRIISGLLAKALTGGAVPALQVANRPQAAQEQGR